MTTHIKSINRKVWKVVETKIDLDPRNRYTTTPLVINHANAIDLAEKAFLQANRKD